MLRLPFLLLLPALLTACVRAPADESASEPLEAVLLREMGAAPALDPALRSVLWEPIMVDPALAQSANLDVVRPPTQPETLALPAEAIASRGSPAEGDDVRPAPAPSGDCPQCDAARASLTLGALAESQQAAPRCLAALGYSAEWANHLPPGVPLHRNARVMEAAGSNAAGCALRLVSFASAAAPAGLIDWYHTRLVAAGYRAQHRAKGTMHILSGAKAADGDRILLVLRERAGGGAQVELMADRGG